MSRKKKITIHIGILCMVCFSMVICSIQPAYAKGDVYSSIDDYLQRCVENANIPAMSVSIVNKNEVLFSGNYGQCESSDTPFLLGSVSKSFTAVCIMQLVEQQKLDLTAAVSTYLPNATDGDKITVSQLLNHTSGLGEIIETVSGKPYSEYISENLFEPLGLSHTAATLDKSIENGLIDGYTNYWGLPVKTAHKYPSSKAAWITVPAGYISASSSDLGKYLQMYLNDGNGIISKESINTMFYGDNVYVEGDIPFWYGYGWAAVKDPLPEPVLRHSGLVETGTSCVFIMPQSDMAIAIEANVNDYFVANEMMNSIGWGIVLMLLGSPPNEIRDNAYMLRHLYIDLIMLAVLFCAILPWCFLPRYIHNGRRGKISLKVMGLVLFHILLPVFILLLVPVFFATPLWVAKAFVPDVFITVIISSALLFIAGFVKSIILLRFTREGFQLTADKDCSK